MQGKGSKKSLEKSIVRTHNGRGKDISGFYNKPLFHETI